jgi:signal transduction histidine kinase
VFGYLVLAALTSYMLAYIETKKTVPRILSRAVLFISSFAVLLATISQFTDMYYLIDENNLYHRQDLYWLSQVFPVSILILNMGIILYFRKTLRLRAMLFFLTYMVLPVIAIFIQTIYYGITLVNIASTLTGLILYIGIQTDQNARLRQNAAMIEQQLELMQSHISETKRAHHDLRHHLSILRSYTDTGEIEKIKEYLDEYVKSIPDDAELSYCENYAVNSILRYYIGMAKTEGIQVDARIELPKNINISDTDLCIIFGNCIENAIEACRRIKGKKFIKINSKIINKILSITIDNSFDGTIKEADGNYLSLKHEGEGIGISSVKSVVRKYGETVQFEVKDNTFQVAIILPFSFQVK